METIFINIKYFFYSPSKFQALLAVLESNTKIRENKVMKATLFLPFLLLFFPLEAKLSIQIESPYACMMNADTGRVLYEKNARTKMYPASTMKLATMLYTYEQKKDSLAEYVTVHPDALLRTTEQEKKLKNYAVPAYYLEPDGTMIYIRKHEKLSIESLLFGAHMRSGNDACNALAVHLSGDIPSFMVDFNAWVQNLGVENTNFVNPHGLHHPEHYSTAYDMALIGRAAYHNPNFMEMALKRQYTKPKTNLQKQETWKSNSCILRQDDELSYSKALFAKTGQMKTAKYCLVAAATNGERTLIAAIHKSPTWKQRYLDVIQMFEAAFNEEKESRLLFSKEDTRFEKEIPGANKLLVAVPDDDIVLQYYPSEEPKVEADLEWVEENLTLPIKEGGLVARINLYDGNKDPIKSFDLHASQAVKKKRMFRPKWAVIGACLFVLVGYRLFKRRPEKSE